MKRINKIERERRLRSYMDYSDPDRVKMHRKREQAELLRLMQVGIIVQQMQQF